MISVGIDYSIQSPGIAVCTGEFRLENVDMHYLTSVQKAAKYSGTAKLHGTFFKPNVQEMQHEERLDFISDWALSIINPLPKTACIFMEGYSFNSTGSSVFQIAENSGLLKHKLFKAGYSFNLLDPNTLKKYASGRGDATKLMMEKAFIKQYSLNIKAELKQTADNPSSDIIDSFFLARYAHDHQRSHSTVPV